MMNAKLPETCIQTDEQYLLACRILFLVLDKYELQISFGGSYTILHRVNNCIIILFDVCVPLPKYL